MAKKIEAFWDCAYCGQKGIGGLTKQCPNCGHPQDKDIRFYLPEDVEEHVLDENTASQYGKGADWMCSYCNSLNRYNETICHNCGADRNEQLGDYFSNKDESDHSHDDTNLKNKNTSIKEGTSTRFRYQKATKNTKQKQKRKIGCLPIIGIFFAIMLFVFWPRTSEATVMEKDWDRSISIEEYKTVQEDDWSVPDGGRVYNKKKEIHHYTQELDHYENVQVQKSRQVLDGYDVSYDYVNNGDGTYDQVKRSTPRYRTETYYETERQPVYRDVPVYKTKYYYEIDKWVPTRSVDTNGGSDEPYWGQVSLGSSEREGEHTETYTLTFRTKKEKTYSVNLSQDAWSKFTEGDSAKITVQSGRITKINDTEIEDL